MLQLLRRIHIVRDDRALAQLSSELLAPSTTKTVSFINQHGFNLACADPDFRLALEQSDILLRDGVGLEFCLRMIGRDAGLNTNGTDLIPQLLDAARGRRVMVAGTSEPWLSRAVARLKGQGVDIVAAIDGFQPTASYLDLVATSTPEILVLAMGMPRQERLAAELAGSPFRPELIINGGAILDFYAGRVRRAPLLFQRARLEWVFRLVQEPQRLARRYLAGGPSFLLKVLEIRATSRSGS